MFRNGPVQHLRLDSKLSLSLSSTSQLPKSVVSKSLRLRKLTLTECGGIISLHLECPSLITFILSGCASLERASLTLAQVISVEVRGLIRLRKLSLTAPGLRRLRVGSPRLESLYLDQCGALHRLAFFGCRALQDEQLLNAGRRCPDVRTLTLMDCGSATARGLREFKKVTSLDVKGSIIVDTPDLYDSCPNLRVLNIGTSDDDDVSRMQWAHTMGQDLSEGGRLPKLRELMVLNSFGSAAILGVLTRCLHLSKVSVTSGKTLRELRLSKLSDEEKHPTHLLDFCASKCPVLREVTCESNSVWRSLMMLNLSECYKLTSVTLECPNLVTLLIR